MTASPVHIGIDLAWGAKNRTGLAAVAADGRLLASGSATTDDEIVDWISRFGDLGVVAIDAPLIVVNQAGRRDCESAIHKHFGRFEASPHSTNLGKPEMRPPRGAVIAELRAGASSARSPRQRRSTAT
jgi:predicted RNase H-like nuclease